MKNEKPRPEASASADAAAAVAEVEASADARRAAVAVVLCEPPLITERPHDEAALARLPRREPAPALAMVRLSRPPALNGGASSPVWCLGPPAAALEAVDMAGDVAVVRTRIAWRVTASSSRQGRSTGLGTPARAIRCSIESGGVEGRDARRWRASGMPVVDAVRPTPAPCDADAAAEGEERDVATLRPPVLPRRPEMLRPASDSV